MTDLRLIGVDVESTDLRSGLLLEVGIALLTHGLDTIDEWHHTITYPAVILDAVRIVSPDTVQRMHTRNGLWDECVSDTPDVPMNLWPDIGPQLAHTGVASIEADAREWLASHDVALGTLPMFGATCHFDRWWLRLWMPSLDATFHYRNVDVSTVRELAARWWPGLRDTEPAAQDLHRALPDLWDATAVAKHYQTHLSTT